MSVKQIRWLGLGAFLLILLLGYWASYRNVTLVLNGEEIELSTRALTVSGALKDAGIDINSEDVVLPNRLSLLSNGTSIVLFRALHYQIDVDGQIVDIVSTERNPQILLEDAGIVMGAGDAIFQNGIRVNLQSKFSFSDFQQLLVRRAFALTLIDGQDEIPIWTAALSIGEALDEIGVTLYEGDVISPSIESEINSGSIIYLDRAEPLEILIGDERVLVRSAAETVGEALANAGIALQGLDRSDPLEDQAIPEPRKIIVTRVEELIETKTEIIPFSIEWQGDPNTEIDERSVIQAGQNGLTANSVRVLYENGKEVSRVNEGEWILSQPETQISGFGTKIVIRSAVVDGVTIEYWRTLELFATSYSPCRSGVEACYYYTALGDEVKQGITAVYLSWWYAMGQHTVFVPGYGPAKISDNGAYPDGRPWIDLGYSDEDWVPWAEWVTVYFTTPVPPEHEILYLLP